MGIFKCLQNMYAQNLEINLRKKLRKRAKPACQINFTGTVILIKFVFQIHNSFHCLSKFYFVWMVINSYFKVIIS